MIRVFDVFEIRNLKCTGVQVKMGTQTIRREFGRGCVGGNGGSDNLI
ncbi:hypothetical protein [Anaerobium acetethylicum]|uniref:Uncharacterized protein n=1 Tax=Anaerobium acetethylicum TaxID=1619234 RepID=A0A1D3TXF3_9FIRM|nr:hypothetical protein [Anaerobium acetethylicum]SCP99020.1 hypothetical protein SAMN05421730_10311 [Anaerobium acetethylicum]